MMPVHREKRGPLLLRMSRGRRNANKLARLSAFNHDSGLVVDPLSAAQCADRLKGGDELSCDATNGGLCLGENAKAAQSIAYAGCVFARSSQSLCGRARG